MTTIEGVTAVLGLMPRWDAGLYFYGAVATASLFLILGNVAPYVKPDALSSSYYGYAGVIIAALFSNIAAMWLAVKVVYAGTNWISGLFYQYHTSNALSCFLGIY